MHKQIPLIAVLILLIQSGSALAIKYDFSENGKDYGVTYEPNDFRATTLGVLNLSHIFGHAKGKVGKITFNNNEYSGFYRKHDDYGSFGGSVNVNDCYLMAGPFQTFSGNGKIYVTFDWFSYVKAPYPPDDSVILHFFIKKGTNNLEYKQVHMGEFNRWAGSYNYNDTNPSGSGLTTFIDNHWRHQSGQITLSYETDNPSEIGQVWGGICAFQNVGVGVKSVKMQFIYND